MRVSGIELPDNLRSVTAFTKFYGIGPSLAKIISQKSQINPDTRVKDLTRDQISTLMKILEEFSIEGDLRREVRQNIDRLKSIKCYRGLRHIVSLPVRGQRTKSNARTRKGRKKTVGSLTKEAWAKIEAQQKAAEISKNK